MISKKLQSLASIYGCEIIEKYSGEGFVLYAKHGKMEEFLCRTYYAAHVDLDQIRPILERVSGKPLAQFWTRGSEVAEC